MKRNKTIDIIKVIFAISIANSHFLGSFFDAGVIVNAFFTMSGYYLAQNQELKQNQSPWDYTLHRVKRIYPEYLLALGILFLTIVVTEWNGAGGLLSWLYDLLPEIIMIQNTGIFDGGINYPCWQLTTLFIVSHIMYSLLTFNKQLVKNTICPLIVLLVYTFFHHTEVTQSVADWGVINGLFYMPLIRALAGVALGVTIYEPVCRLKRYVEKNRCKRVTIFLLSLKWCCIAAFFLWRDRNIAIFLFACIFTCIQTNVQIDISLHKRLSPTRKAVPWGAISLHIYLFHAWLIRIFKLMFSGNLNDNHLLWTVLFDISIILFAIAVEYYFSKGTNKKEKCVVIK